jgi:DNA-binding GntR family transcriptional regulator
MPADAFPALLKPVPLTNQVGELIKGRILRGELRPGERLVEQQLAKSLGVGQNVIREALIDLAHHGFVRRYANRGTYVTQLTLAEARKLAEVRISLEGLAVELAARRAASEPLDWKPLEELLAQMRRYAEAGDRESFYDADLKFHQRLWELAGNEYLAQLLEQIVVPLFAFFIMLYMRKTNVTEKLLDAVEAHEKVLDALRSSGAAAGAEAMRSLVDLSLQHQKGLVSQD